MTLDTALVLVFTVLHLLGARLSYYPRFPRLQPVYTPDTSAQRSTTTPDPMNPPLSSAPSRCSAKIRAVGDELFETYNLAPWWGKVLTGQFGSPFKSCGTSSYKGSWQKRAANFLEGNAPRNEHRSMSFSEREKFIKSFNSEVN